MKTDFQAIGKGGDKLISVFLSEGTGGEPREGNRGRASQTFQTRIAPSGEAVPSAAGFIERPSRRWIEIALASSAKGDELEEYKRITGIGPFLAKDTSSDDVSNSKPDPDVFRAAQRKLGVDPSNIIAIGDTQHDCRVGR